MPLLPAHDSDEIFSHPQIQGRTYDQDLVKQHVPLPWPRWLAQKQSRDLDQPDRFHSKILLKLVNGDDPSWKPLAITVMGKVASNGANPKGSRAERSRGTMSWWSCLVLESPTSEARNILRPFSYATQQYVPPPHFPHPAGSWVCVTHSQEFQQIESLLFTNSQKSGATRSTQPRSETPLVPWRQLPERPFSA